MDGLQAGHTARSRVSPSSGKRHQLTPGAALAKPGLRNVIGTQTTRT